jgi:hypothetical protein
MASLMFLDDLSGDNYGLINPALETKNDYSTGYMKQL